MPTVFSRKPDDLGVLDIQCEEMMFVQYMPIAMPGTIVRIPPHLQSFTPLVERVLQYVGKDYFDKYVYLTAKHMYIAEGMTPNRPGWHIDGYGTEDYNFVWSNAMPTEFCVGMDFELSENHELSLQQMNAQALRPGMYGGSVIAYPDNTLLGLDNTIVHRVATKFKPGMRTFAKVSVSRDKYNLKGNAHNYLFDYEWNMVERTEQRNHPVGRK